MIATGVPLADVRRIVAQVSAEHYSGNIIIREASELSATRTRFTLRVADSRGPGARYSASPYGQRRTIAVCWYGHRDVLRAIFAEFPHARIYTAMARYIGADGFEKTFSSTAHRNIGSMMFPMSAANEELCSDACPYHGDLTGGPYGRHADEWEVLSNA